jgi:hypothetical protein
MGVKAIVGYELVDGVTPEDYERWLREVHVPDLLANPHVDRLVFNRIEEQVTTLSGTAVPTGQDVELYRVGEIHFADLEAVQRYRDWFARNPLPAERTPERRVRVRFYVICTSEEVTR